MCPIVFFELIDVAHKEGLLHENSVLGFQGEPFVRKKARICIEGIIQRILLSGSYDRLIFVSSALPRGASVMARCMEVLEIKNATHWGKSRRRMYSRPKKSL